MAEDQDAYLSERRRPERRARTLTDEDVEAIAEALQRHLFAGFLRAGERGLWSLVKAMLARAAIGALLALAGYYYALTHGGHP